MTDYGSVSVDAFTIGWPCAHPLELEIASKMMDERLPGLPSHPSDSNTYALGLIEGHFIVAAFSPTAEKGTSPVTAAARHMRLSFPSVRFGISIGISIGIPIGIASWVAHPGDNLDIRLGNVVMIQSLNNCDEAVQYDLGKVVDGHVTYMERKVAPLSTTVIAALEKLRTNYFRNRTRVSEHLSKLSFLHSFGTPEEARSATYQALSHGSIVFPPEVMRDGQTPRSDIHELVDVSLFGNEVADLRTEASQSDLSLVIIRGICNRNDSEILQLHAVAAAASYAKELLQILPPLVVLISPKDKSACKYESRSTYAHRH
ncbi:nucleoside phosphorylase [Colletotrichum graminicola M1.001]|uniref:Nucleoside phosphorylase n=1 Tax=Colletotrichum graminicola (strain M1.001 / M2 / FGSC 10212) TaxID=645133 RepID=E3Q3Z1_COLGM|nr:nucleoside phosphorylase [Colletotrichum graminicola M1.001]EFQ25743.1 nucleoside phosphorylase [Colletotrichum graminicola M1.001]